MQLLHVSAKQAHRILGAQPETVVLDLRTPDEFEMFYIKNAVNLDCQSPYFERRLKALPRQTPYLIHCHSGGRSLKTLDLFERLGFEKIIHMDEGLRAWMHADLPLISNWSI